MASRLANIDGAPPPYSFVRRYYNRSLRPILLTLTSTAIVAGALWCAASFRNRGNDRRINPKLPTFDLVFGVIFAVLTVFELIGLHAAWGRRVTLMRVYSLLSVISVLAIVAVQILEIVTDFMFKNDLINECIREVTSSNTSDCSGYWCTDSPMTQTDGNHYCRHQWTKITLGDFAWLIIAFFCSTLFSYIAFAYLHELRAIGRPLNAQRYAMQDYPAEYDGSDNRYPPPPGPPPPLEDLYDNASKPPDYEPASPGYRYEPEAKMKSIEDD